MNTSSLFTPSQIWSPCERQYCLLQSLQVFRREAFRSSSPVEGVEVGFVAAALDEEEREVEDSSSLSRERRMWRILFAGLCV